MVTGASTADAAVILIDARTGVSTQTRRHSFICSLLGIKNIVLAVNKMDLVNYDRDTFSKITNDFSSYQLNLDFQSVSCIPLSALHGETWWDALRRHLGILGLL